MNKYEPEEWETRLITAIASGIAPIDARIHFISEVSFERMEFACQGELMHLLIDCFRNLEKIAISDGEQARDYYVIQGERLDDFIGGMWRFVLVVE
jgi:hypothetical protein